MHRERPVKCSISMYVIVEEKRTFICTLLYPIASRFRFGNRATTRFEKSPTSSVGDQDKSHKHLNSMMVAPRSGEIWSRLCEPSQSRISSTVSEVILDRRVFVRLDVVSKRTIDSDLGKVIPLKEMCLPRVYQGLSFAYPLIMTF